MDEDTDPEETEASELPSVISSSVVIPAPIPLKFQDSQDDTLKANIQTYNTMLAVVHGLWGKASSFGKAIALLNQIEKLIKLRAEIMGHPYGVAVRESNKRYTIYPDD